MKKPGRVAIAFFAVVILGAIVMGNDLPGGPSLELEGIVRGTVATARESPPLQFATVGLAEIGEVRAVVGSGLIVHTGQTVRVREYRRIITGAKTYEVVSVKDTK
jgi:hypothetical protein